MQTWFHVGSWNKTKITTVQVVKFTPAYVTIRDQEVSGRAYNRRAVRVSDLDAYFPTWAEARAHVVSKATEALEAARKAVSEAEDYLAAANAIPLEQPHD